MNGTRLECASGFTTQVRGDQLVLVSVSGAVVEGVPVEVVDDAQYRVDAVYLELDEQGAVLRAMVGSLI